MDEKNIDELLREKLKDYEKVPPAFVYDNIKAGISARQRKRRLIYWKVESVAAALLLAFGAGWQINELNSKGEKQTMMANHTISSENKESKMDVQKTETLSNSPSAHATNETDTQAKASRSSNQQLASKTGRSENNISVQQEPGLQKADPVKMYPVRSLGAKVENKDGFAATLQEKKVKRVPEELTLSTDQQIMEQNRQMAQARNASRRQNRWMVGAQVSPAMSVNRSSQSPEYASNMLSSSNTSQVDLGAGLSVEYKSKKRWSIQSGVYYAGLGQATANVSNVQKNEAASTDKGMEYFNTPVSIEASKIRLNSRAGVIELQNIPTGMAVASNIEDKLLSTSVVASNTRLIQDFQYLEIPLYLRYTLIDAHLDVELMGGVSSNMLVGNNTYLDNSNGKTLVGRTRDMQNMSYSSSLGLGLKYGISRRVFLNVEPRVKYYLNSLNNNPEVNYKPYTIGVFTGVSYSF